MPSPFPGMDPYLEDPAGWPDFHAEMLSAIRAELAPRVLPDFHVRIEDRVYVVDPESDPGYCFAVPDVVVSRPKRPRPAVPSAASAGEITPPVLIEDVQEVEIRDHFIEVQDARSGEVVTVIELLSPSNKIAGSRGRAELLSKRRRLRAGGVNWLEIDLLRAGERPVPLRLRDDYAVLLFPAGGSRLSLWSFGIRDRLPTVAVPLRAPRPDAALDLGAALTRAYDRARWADTVAYDGPLPPPPLPEADAEWVRERRRR